MTTTDKRARQATGAEALWRRLQTDAGVWRFDNAEDVLRALAFCGLGEARELVDLGHLLHFASSDLEDFTKGLRILLAKLPPHRLEELECDHWLPNEVHPSMEYKSAVGCKRCGQSGVYNHDTPAQLWLMVAASLAVARECAAASDTRTCLAAGPAGAACEAWLAEPTRAKMETWEQVWLHAGVHAPAWLPSPAPNAVGGVLQAAAEILTPARVREIAGAEVVRLILHG